MRLAIVIVSWNTAARLADCLRSLDAGAQSVSYTVVVVDNASGDGSPDMVAREFPHVCLIRNETNAGFARACNQGLQAAAAEYALLLNSDTVVESGTLARLVAFMDAHPEAGACGPRLLRPDGSPQPFSFGGDPTPLYLLARDIKYLVLRRHLHDWATAQVRAVDWVSGACLLARRAAVERIGLLDENIFMYFEDNDWCLRLRRAGWKVYYNPHAEVVHLGGESLRQNPRARRVYFESLRYFYGKHYGPLASLLLRVMLAGHGFVRRLGADDLS